MFRRVIESLVVIVVLGFTAYAQDQCFLIVDGFGAGFVVQANGDDEVVDEQRGHEGIIAGSSEDCDCTHYHGYLYGFPDPDPEGCGWGCVVTVPCPEDLFEELESLINDMDNPFTKDKFLAMLETMDNAFGMDCVDALFAMVTASGQELIAADAHNAHGLSDEELDDLIDLLADLAWLFSAITVPPQNPVIKPDPKKPPRPCDVDLYVRLGSGDNTVLGDAGGKFTARPGSMVSLVAVGNEPGGTYEWEIKPDPIPSGFGVSTGGNRATVFGRFNGKIKVKVIYHCPNGKTAKDKITIKYNSRYLR